MQIEACLYKTHNAFSRIARIATFLYFCVIQWTTDYSARVIQTAIGMRRVTSLT